MSRVRYATCPFVAVGETERGVAEDSHPVRDKCVAFRNVLGEFLHCRAKDLVLRHEIRFTVHFDQGGRLCAGKHVGRDQAVGGGSTGLLLGDDGALLAQNGLGLFNVAARLFERPLAVHHAGVGAFAQLLD